MILMGTENDRRVGVDRTDDRLVGLKDVMPTLLGLAGLEVPPSVEGLSMVDNQWRSHFYGEFGEVGHCSRMIRDHRDKLIWHPVGNVFQLFDLDEDPDEMTNLADEAEHKDTRGRLTALLQGELYGSDEAWIKGGKLVGEPGRSFRPGPNRGLSLVRGH